MQVLINSGRIKYKKVLNQKCIFFYYNNNGILKFSCFKNQHFLLGFSISKRRTDKECLEQEKEKNL